MESLRRVTRFWNWLPAFRVVAETEHLPTAAQAFGVSAPGLSRAVKLLEAEVGQPLFERSSRRLQLNPAGRHFLEHVRDAMRRVDDGLQGLRQETFRGALRINSSLSVAQAYALPAVALLRREHPLLEVALLNLGEEQVSDALRQGDLDVAFMEHSEVRADLAVEPLTVTQYGLYCGADHALANRPDVTLDQCLAHPFVGPVAGATDAWPPGLRRTVALRVGGPGLAMTACEQGGYLALLPDDFAGGGASTLHRLPVGSLVETPVFLAYRKPLGVRDRVAVFLEAVRATARSRCGLRGGSGSRRS